MQPGGPYSLISEMLETPGILRRFDAAQLSPWISAIDARKKLLLTGEGSSRIFPAKNLVDLSLRRNSKWQVCTEGARQAAEYDLDEFIVLAASNSGRTKELISLFEKLKREGIPCYGVTATAGSRLTEIATGSRILSCGAEKAVASSKSTVEQALTFQALLAGDEWKQQAKAADLCENTLSQNLPASFVDAVKDAPIIYFAGRNSGVAEELTLKANEIARKKSVYLEGTYALHGIEEVMKKGETVVLVEPFRDDLEKYQKVLAEGAGVKVIAIASADTPFPTIKLPALPGFDAYLQLMAGWNLLVAAALANGVNIDKPERVRKVGNEI